MEKELQVRAYQKNAEKYREQSANHHGVKATNGNGAAADETPQPL